MSDPLVIQESGGSITVPGGVLDGIVRRAAEEVAGVRVRRRGVSVTDSRVTLGVSVRYGEVLPQIAEDVQRRIAAGLSAMCGLDEVAVDVSIEELT